MDSIRLLFPLTTAESTTLLLVRRFFSPLTFSTHPLVIAWDCPVNAEFRLETSLSVALKMAFVLLTRRRQSIRQCKTYPESFGRLQSVPQEHKRRSRRQLFHSLVAMCTTASNSVLFLLFCLKAFLISFSIERLAFFVLIAVCDPIFVTANTIK